MEKKYNIVHLPDDEPYRWWKLYDDTIIIHYGEALDTFLLLGSEKALLIDTAYGRGDFPNIVDMLKGDRELLVVNTHEHFDHTGGNRFYPRVYMHPSAFENADHAFGKLDEEWLANMPYPDYEKIGIEDGYVFHLGGRDVEVLHTPAHCQSSLSFIDHGRRLLFCGDEFDAGQANLNVFASVGAFLNNCRRLQARKDEFDLIMPNHNGCPVSVQYLDDFVTAAQHVVEGKPDLVSMDDLQGFQKGFFPGLLRVQVGSSCINYLPEGVKPERPAAAKSTLHEDEYPVLEYDENRTAKLNPPVFVDTPFLFDKMVITFFPEVIDKLLEEDLITLERVIGGENPITIYQFLDSNVLLTLGQIGCPACGGNLDLFHAMGIRKVMFCGGGGVLDKNIEVGQLLLVEGAIRDEGFSYQYIEPSRIIRTDPETTDKIADYLEQNSIFYQRGLTWTTDALFRETPERIRKRKEEGAKIVEMEQAGCIAIAQFRGLEYGALIYGGDDVSQEEWSNRAWRSRKGVRYDLVELCRRLTRVI